MNFSCFYFRVNYKCIIALTTSMTKREQKRTAPKNNQGLSQQLTTTFRHNKLTMLCVCVCVFCYSKTHCGNRHVWEPSADQRSRDGLLYLHEQEGEAHWQGEELKC